MLIAWRLTLTHRSLSPCPHGVCAQCDEVGVATSATVDMCLNVLHVDPVYMYIRTCTYTSVTCFKLKLLY